MEPQTLGLAAVTAGREETAMSEVSWCLEISLEDTICSVAFGEWHICFTELLMLIQSWILYISSRNA